ncbi:hypothetical protein [Cysteiniphilum sp. JM-1]|uniref:hypothetical protein n=1 Tax=Cysteiniphilum sp. JM-1 TaxID=2610891 RepID=UPI001248218C|nr:hypothetical protein [Cysteiniphilum sp. JM-1]
MSGIVHQTKEYRHGFGQSTSYTHPGNWNGLPDGVSMLKEPTKSCFRRHGVLTGLSIAGETYDPSLEVYLPAKGNEAQKAWPMTYMTWDGQTASPIHIGFIIDLASHKKIVSSAQNMSKVEAKIKFNCYCADGSVSEDDPWFTEFSSDDTELVVEIPVNDGELAFGPVDGVTIEKEGNVTNVEWRMSVLPPKGSSGKVMRATDKEAKLSLAWTRG